MKRILAFALALSAVPALAQAPGGAFTGTLDGTPVTCQIWPMQSDFGRFGTTLTVSIVTNRCEGGEGPEGGEDGDRQLDIPVESPEEELADRISLAEVIEALPEQDKQLIRLRFYGNRTQSETAKALHTTQVQISRRERKILIRLRARLLEE